MARSLSAFYALVGALCLMLACDLDRYRPLLQFLGVCLALVGIVMTGIDLSAGMPWCWTAMIAGSNRQKHGRLEKNRRLKGIANGTEQYVSS